ncbi:Hypothetical protein, putative [Bodo saltans]|uniref:Membrane-associated protein n=1 Tax=Bodo saltans TaxID=75058 RepID=A0A0S4JST3_BODSA|nr:Hypothetical protein, putative [Bodo saltans]|eukprot:CUG93299.1 Hypothetical protein, putative [Bodo saltans]
MASCATLLLAAVVFVAISYSVAADCAYTCPDSTCAADLAHCTCNPNPALGTIALSYSSTINGASISAPLSITMNATYGAPFGGCASFDFTPYVTNSWSFFYSWGGLAYSATTSGSNSVLTIPAHAFTSNGTYMMLLTATPLLGSSQTVSASIIFGPAPPTVTVNGPTTIDVSEAFTATASVSFLADTYGFQWSCSPRDIVFPSLCPNTSTGTINGLTVPANPTGQPGRVYLYFYYFWGTTSLSSAFSSGNYVSATLAVTFTSANPSVKMINTLDNQILDYNVVASTQQIALWSVTNYSAAYNRVWSVNGVVLNETQDNITIAASLSALRTTPMSLFQLNSQRTINYIRINVTDAANSSLTSYSEVQVTVLEPIVATLAVTNANGVDSTAVAIADTLQLNYTTPQLNASYYWYSSFAVSFVYYTTTNGVETAVALTTQVNGTNVTALAPQLPDTSVASAAIKFGIVVRISSYGQNVVVATANATFNVTRNANCLYQCPDLTCVTSTSWTPLITSCACSVNAVIGVPSITFNYDPSAFRNLEVFNATAHATYTVPSGNCAGFDFSPYLQYSWSSPVNPSGTTLNFGNSQSLVLASNWFGSYMLGTYNFTVTVTGLTDPSTYNYPKVIASALVTAIDLKPNVTLSAPTTISLAESFNVTANVAFPLSAANISWNCFSGTGGNTVLCPALPTGNSSTFLFPANPTGPAGSVMVVAYYWYAATTLDNAYAAGSYVSATVIIDLTSAGATPAPSTPAPSTPVPTPAGCAGSSVNESLLFENIPASCIQPFDCFAEFCLCVNGTVSTTCTPFDSNINASTVEMCTANRLTCIIRAALDTATVWDASCQKWGDSVTELYSEYYSDRSSVNLTDLCRAEACTLVTAGSAELATAVNYNTICQIDVNEIGAPLGDGDVAGCVEPPRTHFDDVPIQCGGAANCSNDYCVCLGGTWSAATSDCTLPPAQPLDSIFDGCLATYISCVTNVALDVYVPGASPLNTDPCLVWAVPIAEDYALYYNATHSNTTTAAATDTTTALQSTSLWLACNYTACKDIYRYNHTSHFSSACTFASVTRAPTFTPYNACPYSCPDTTCAANLASCACTANAVVSGLNTTANYDLANVLPTTQLQIAASASYAVISGNCSNFTFGSSLKYTWSVTNASNQIVYSYNGSTLTIPSNTLTAGSYRATVTAAGLLSSQKQSSVLSITVIVLSPVVRISGPTLATTLRSFALTATIINPATTSSFNWTCISLTADVSCPSLTGGASTSLFIASGAPAGLFNITYQYFANAATTTTATVSLTITNNDIPVVSVAQALTGSIAASAYGVNAFANTQKISVSGTVQFSGTYTRSWSVNGVQVTGAGDAVAVTAAQLKTTTFANAKAGSYVYNTITLTATSNANSNVMGNASVSVVVLEPVTTTLAVAKQGSSATFAAGLTDYLVFTTSSTPSLTTTSVPLGATLQTSIVYYTVTNGVESPSLSLLTTVSGNAQVGQAPLAPGANSSGVLIKFGVQVSLSGIVVASANSSFNITLANASAAASSILASTASITDANEAVQALGNIGALLSSFTSTSTTATSIVSAGFTMIVSTIVIGTQLSAAQSLSVATNVATLLTMSSSQGNNAEASKQVVAVMFVVLTGTSFDLSVASAVGSTIGQMDPASGGVVAQQMTLVICAQILVGETASVNMGPSGSMTAASSTGASLLGLAVTDSASGVSVLLPTTLLNDVPGLSADATYGAVTLFLVSVSSFTTNGTDVPAGGIVSQQITSGNTQVSINGLQTAIIISMPPGSTGECRYYDEVTKLWFVDGVTTVFTETGAMNCYTTI